MFQEIENKPAKIAEAGTEVKGHHDAPAQQFALMKTKRFLPLFVTQTLGTFNDNVFKNALTIFLTYQLVTALELHGSYYIVLAAWIFILPFFLFSATAGILADRYEKTKLIQIIKFFEIILTLLAIKGFFQSSIPLLFLALFLIGTKASFFGPVKYSILPYHLKDEELIAGNGMIEAGTFIAILLGTCIGGLCISSTIGIYIISFILVAASLLGFISSWYIPKTKANSHLENSNAKLSFNFVKDTLEIIQYSRNHKSIFITILGISWFWLVGSVFIALFPLLTKNILQANENVFTYFIALFSIGIAIGSLFCHRLLKGRVQTTFIPLGALGMSFFIFDIYFALNTINTINSSDKTELMGLLQFFASPGSFRLSLDFLFCSIFAGLYTVPLYTLLQSRTEDSHRSRVIASNNIFNALFMVVGVFTIMILVKLGFSVKQLFLITACFSTLVALYISKLLPDDLIKSFFIWILNTLYRVEVIGMEHFLNADKRVLIIANHTSYLDALLLACFLPEKLTYAVDSVTAEKWWIQLFLRMVDYFPLNPTNPMAIKSLIEFIKKDRRCVIFPEGRLTMTGTLMKVYEGPGMIADKAGAKILPICIQGAQLTPFSRMRGKVKLKFAPKITITIFPQQALEIPANIAGRNRRSQSSMQLYDLMSTTLFNSSAYEKTLFESLIEAQSLHGSKFKIIEDIDRNPSSYQQFMMRSFILGGIIAKKTSIAEPVGILLPNMISAALTFFALQAYCRIPAMLNFSAGARNILIACNTAKVKRVYTSIKFIKLAKLNSVVSTLQDAGIEVIYLETLRDSLGLWDKLKGVFLAQFPGLAYKFINSKVLPQHKSPESCAVILFTSGSEGTPKGVQLSHRNVQSNRHQLSARVDFIRTDKIFNALPIFHSFGLTAGMLLPLLSGVRVFFYPSPLHYRIIPELCYDSNATILFGTDTFLSSYAKYANQYDFYSVRYVFAGAEKLREETRSAWVNKFGVRIFEGYGTTETSPVLATNTPIHSKIGTVGRFLPCIQYKLQPVEGIEKGGILQVQGPNIMMGYLLADNPGILIPPKEGWYDTGDIVSVDEMGYVIIKGRVKRFAKIGGEMVSLPMVENEIYKLWPDHKHAVVAIPDPKKGEQLVLVSNNSDANQEDIIKHAKMCQMPDISIPKTILFIKDLPVLGTGKTDYTSIKEFVLSSVTS